MLANLIILENPFKPHNTTSKAIEIPLAGLPVSELEIDGKWLYAVNGVVVENTHIIQAGDCVAVTPLIEKDYFNQFLKIVLALVLVYIGAGILVFAVLSVAGNALIDSVVPPPTPDMPSLGEDPWNESPTYSWGPLQPTRGQGYTIPLLIGKHKVSGQELSKDITVSDDNQMLHLLMGVCGHEIDNISDIRINDQPINYYRDIVTAVRLGTNDEELIAGFGNIPAISAYNIRLTTTFSTVQTQGNAVEKIAVDFSFAQGLYSMNSDGNIVSTSVDVYIEYRILGSGTWTVYPRQTFTGSSTAPLRRTVEITGLVKDQYEIRCSLVNPESTNVKTRNAVYLSAVTEYILQPIQYNNIAKYAVSALATDQLSGGQPVLSCIAESLTTTVYNPYLSGYEQVDKTNPAWAGYWLLHHIHGVDADVIDYDAFKDFADYCDVLIDGLPRHTCNLYLDANANLWRNLTAIFQIGRGAPMKYGSIYSLIVNKPSTPVHLFDVGNIVPDSLKVNYASSQNKANAIEITYMDADKDFTRQTIGAYSVDYNTADTPDNKASMRLFGCTNEAEILRECAFRLNSTKWLVRTVSFHTNINAIPCRVGQLVYLQHDAPKWSDGGRVVSSTINTITFDKPLNVEAGTSYIFIVQLGDDTLVEREIVNPGTGAYETFTVTVAFIDLPERHNTYMFGSSTDLKRIYRVTSIERVNDLTSKLEVAEHNEAIYTDTDYVFELPEWDPKTQQAVAVNTDEVLTLAPDGSYISHVNVTWMPAYVDDGYDWSIWLEHLDLASAPVHIGRTSKLHHVISADILAMGNTYKVYVTRYNQGPIDLSDVFELGFEVDFTGQFYDNDLNTGQNTDTFKVTRDFDPPSNVIVFTGTYLPITRTVIFNWSQIEDVNLDHYEIREGGADWDNAVSIADGIKGGTVAHYIEFATDDTVTYQIKAVNTAGIYSEDSTVADVLIDTAKTNLPTPTGLTLITGSTITPDGADSVYIRATWDANAEISDEFAHYDLEIESPTGWKNRDITQNTEFTWTISANQTYTVRLRAADKAGNDSDWASSVLLSSKDSTPPERVTWPGLSSDIVPGFKLIALSWVKSSADDIAGYIVERSPDVGFSAPVDLGTISANYFVDTQLDVSVQYWYRVKGVDRSGNSSDLWSIIVTATTLQVGESDIAANSVTANMIKAGEVITTSLESSNYVADTSGYKLDSSIGLAEFNNIEMILNWGTDVGGTSIPAPNADVTSTEVDAGLDTTTGGLIVRNAGTDDYAQLTAGNLKMFYWTGSAHVLYKSLARKEAGFTQNGALVKLPGFWRDTPTISFSAKSLQSYASGFSTQDQTQVFSAVNLMENPAGSREWEFTARCELIISAGVTGGSVLLPDIEAYHAVFPPSTAVWEWLDETTTGIIDTSPTNATNVSYSFNGNIYEHVEEIGSCDDNDTDVERRIYYLYLVLNTTEHLIYTRDDGDTAVNSDDFLNSCGDNDSSSIDFNISGDISVTEGEYDIRFRIKTYVYLDHDDGYYSQDTTEINDGLSLEYTTAADTVLAEGSLNWTAVGE